MNSRSARLPSQTARDSATERPRAWSLTPACWWLAGALVSGLLLRWGVLGRLAIEHHDEAVYASNLLFDSAAGGEFPGRPFYAPPLLPTTIEWFTILWRMAGLPEVDWLPMLPGLLSGSVLIVSVWWILRRWFSPTAGIAGAWLVALSEYHAFYSRTALTDPLLVLWMLWAVHWGWVALGATDRRSWLLAGLFTALAWGTKYNGWLPLAIVISGGACCECLLPREQRRWRRYLEVIVGMAVTAGVLWLPVWWDCQRVGGYAAIAANHRGYIQGWGAWWRDWWQLNSSVGWYTSWLTIAAWFIAPLAAGLNSPQRIRWGWGRGALVVCAAALIAGAPLLVPFLIGTLAVIGAVIDHRRGKISPEQLRAGCLIAAWFAGLLLVTPLYFPYPRLALPLWLAGVLGCGWWWHQAWTPVTPSETPSVPVRWATPIAIAVPVLIVCGLPIVGSVAWESRLATRTAAREFSRSLSDPAATVVYVYADPALFYHLSRLGCVAIPRGELSASPAAGAQETWLAVGPYVGTEELSQAIAASSTSLELAHETPAAASSLVLLDHGVLLATSAHKNPNHRWRWYRVR